jgi:sulfoxide reductase heme-binding subunit YedZ
VLHQLALGTTEDVAHDSGVIDLSVLSARIAYAMMCLSLCWGVMVSRGWVNRLTGRQALRSSHMVLATITLVCASLHVIAFTTLRVGAFGWAQVIIPFHSGNELRYTLGILALEGLYVAAVVVGLRRWLSYWRWLWIHRLAYPAFALGVLHALLSASADGTLNTLWLGGITLLVPAVAFTVLRFVPAKALATTGLIEAP